MAKVRDNNIVLENTEKIIQDETTIIDSDAKGRFDTMNVTTRLKIPTAAPVSPEAGDLWIE